ncbi:Spo0E family sporulation regulatory protein-aspartic acid phosphatase [Peribacillus sp. Hz7]|uniref:Spo0E family sporulation regulatory protein-aspartic acid phosphatase n=1 Tax=Peribacillus sp. Hz7 TaxID=3344873 RepID=UPI0035CC6DFF
MTLMKTHKLENKIYQLRKELIGIAEKTGLNSPDTICCSQKLDQFITIYQKTSLLKREN